MVYMKRLIDETIQELLDMIGAIAITDPKGCGKTTTGKQHSKSIIKLDDPEKIETYLNLAEFEPYELLEGEKPKLIDEWQIIPKTWDAVRHSVDEISEDGLYILTSSKKIDEGKILHSGTGRFNRIVMRPMSLYETNESNGKISIIDLFNNPNRNINGIRSNLRYSDLIFATCRGGWPDSLNMENEKEKLNVAYEYLENICSIDINKLDESKYKPSKVKSVIKAYASNISSSAKKSTLIKDTKTEFPKMTRNTFNKYLNALKKLHIIEDINAWRNIRPSPSIQLTPKRELIDPSLAVATLNLSPKKLKNDSKTFNSLFETLCIRDLLTYTIGVNGKAYYYKDRYGLEVDLILEIDTGDYALFNFNLGKRNMDKCAKSLIKLKELIKEKDEFEFREPKFLAIITGGDVAKTRDDGVKVLPIGCLR